MELWALMQLLLLGTLLDAAQGQGDELSSEEERKALMLKVRKTLSLPWDLWPQWGC